MQKYQNNVTNRAGDAVRGLQVTVNVAGGGLASIFSDNAGTPTDNPITTDANGAFEFYVADGRYDISVNGGGYVDVLIADALQIGVDASAALAGLAQRPTASELAAGTVDLGFQQSGAGAVLRTTEEELRDRVSAEQFGAVADGVTNDTTAFARVEALVPKAVDLAGKSYALTSSWADAVNGVVLSKDYKNGRLLVDGRELVFDAAEGASRSAASIPRMVQPSTSKGVGLFRVDENNYHVWRPLGGQFWQRCTVSRTTTGIPLNWRETHIKQVLGYITARDAGVVYTGGWAVDGGTSALSSASDNTYIGGRGQQAIVAGDYVEISYTGGGDLYVVFAGRTSGNFINVLLDGKKDYLTLSDDGAGNRYFDSYTATDLSYRRVVKIASAVPTGSHTIRLTVSATKNASSAGNRFIFNALAFDSSEFGPWRTEADAIQWAAGQSVLTNQVRKNAGRYYYATGAGATGATPPTHTSGSVSDGTVTWTYRATSGYDLTDHRIQAVGSQLEYAYEIKPTGAANKEDVGGALHGNETQTALAFLVGSTPVSLGDATWASGDGVTINESITATHSEIGGGATPVVLTKLTRTFLRQYVEVAHKHTLQMAAAVGYFYSHMWPLLHYDGPANKYAMRRVWSPCDGYRNCADFYGQTNPFVGRTKDLLMVGYGDALQPNGSGGVPSVEAAPLSFVVWLAVDPSSVGNYADAARIFASKAMNTSGIDVSAGGFSSMTSKMYFEKYSSITPKALLSGAVIECSARYGLALAPAP